MEKNQKIIKHLNNIRNDVQSVERYIDHIEGTSKLTRNIRIEILQIVQAIKLNEQEENAKKKNIQHTTER